MEHKQLFFCLLAGALSVYSGFNLTHSSLNFGTLALYLLTLAVLARAVFYAQLDRFFATLPGHITLGVLGLGAAFAAFVLGFILWNAYGCAPTGQEKAVVVLGAGLRGDRPSRLLRERLDKAYAYYCENPDLTIVVTGGQGRNELRPEGAAMRDYLVARGVPEQQIISEEKSTSTEENFALSRQLMEQAVLRCDAIPVVWGADHRWKSLMRLAFSSRASMIVSTPLIVLGLAKLQNFCRQHRCTQSQRITGQ